MNRPTLSAAGPWRRMQPALWLGCIALPWLNPYASGPSSTVQPWLFTAFCAAVLASLHGLGRLPAIPALTIALLCVGASLRLLFSFDVLALYGACAVILICASVARAETDRPAFIKWVATAWLVAALASSVIAVCQYFGWTRPFEPVMSAAGLGEAYANLRQRNQFASLTSIGLVALLWLTGRGMRSLHAAPMLLLLAVGNAASASRTGAVQWLLVMALAVVAAPRRREMLALCLGGIAAYVLAGLSLSPLLRAATGVEGPSVFVRFAGNDGCSSRAVLWSNVLDLISLKPWLGWGWGELDFAHYMHLYRGDRFCDILDNAHNLPLHLAVEAGVPVALLVCAGVAWTVVRAARGLAGDADRAMAWGVMGVILLHSLLEYPLWYGPFQMALGLCLGLLWQAPRAQGPGLVRRWWAGPLVAAPVLLAIAYGAWDYRRISQIYMPPEARAAAYQDDTLEKLAASWLFRNQVRFAELTVTPLTRANAQWTFDTATELLHYSPEPRVIRKLIESATMLGRDEEAAEHLRRYRAAFPQDHARWSRSLAPN